MANGSDFRNINILSLLQETHEEVLKTNAGNYERWLRLRDEHATLLGFLQTLPDTLSRDVLVPFGCRALLRGTLVHTNEILVRLGDGWFAKCSAKHAADICGRRIGWCNEMLEKLEQERQFLEARRDLPVQQQVFGTPQQADIVESCTEEEEAEWRVRHREKERQYRQKLAEVRKREKKPLIEVEDIWQRLDELELEEELQEELDRLHAENGECNEDDDDDDIDYGEVVEVEEDVDTAQCVGEDDGAKQETSAACDGEVPSETAGKVQTRRVSFPDEPVDTLQDSTEAKRRRVSFSDPPDNIDSDDSEEDLRIEFSHSSNGGTRQLELRDVNIITCPADIYDHYRHAHSKTTSLKSILKKTATTPDEGSASNYLASLDEAPFVNGGSEDVPEEPFIEEENLPPVVGEVVERSVREPPSQGPPEKRPLSRFKAARQASKR